MKLLRISASLIALGMVTALAACGGGGGGGSTPPVGPPGPPPTSSSPSPSPTASTSPAPGGPIGVSSVILNAADGYTNGTDNWQTNGVSAGSDTADGDTSTGGTGSNTVDGVSCSLPNGEATGTTYYHQHAFVGIMVNGTEYAIPDAVGMQNPGSGEPILTFTCAYNIHTHAASGIVHVEDPTLSNTAAAPAQYNLQTLFDIWGQSMSSLSISGASGAPAIYVGSHISKRSCSCAQNGDDVVDGYTAATGAASSLLLTHHAAYWLVYGTPPAAGLPQIDFGIE